MINFWRRIFSWDIYMGYDPLKYETRWELACWEDLISRLLGKKIIAFFNLDSMQIEYSNSDEEWFPESAKILILKVDINQVLSPDKILDLYTNYELIRGSSYEITYDNLSQAPQDEDRFVEEYERLVEEYERYMNTSVEKRKKVHPWYYTNERYRTRFKQVWKWHEYYKSFYDFIITNETDIKDFLHKNYKGMKFNFPRDSKVPEIINRDMQIPNQNNRSELIYERDFLNQWEIAEQLSISMAENILTNIYQLLEETSVEINVYLNMLTLAINTIPSQKQVKRNSKEEYVLIGKLKAKLDLSYFKPRTEDYWGGPTSSVREMPVNMAFKWEIQFDVRWREYFSVSYDYDPYDPSGDQMMTTDQPEYVIYESHCYYNELNFLILILLARKQILSRFVDHLDISYTENSIRIQPLSEHDRLLDTFRLLTKEEFVDILPSQNFFRSREDIIKKIFGVELQKLSKDELYIDPLFQELILKRLATQNLEISSIPDFDYSSLHSKREN